MGTHHSATVVRYSRGLGSAVSSPGTPGMGGQHIVWYSLPWLEMCCRCVVLIDYLGVFR